MSASDSGRGSGGRSMIGVRKAIFPTTAASGRCAPSCAPSVEAGHIREPRLTNPPRKHDLKSMGAPIGACQEFTVGFF